MATVDIENLKRVAADLSARELSRRGSPKTLEASDKNRREIQQLLKSYTERADFPIEELNRLRAERQAERRRLLESQAADAAQVTNEEEVAFRHAVESQRDASRLLSSPAALITLDEPIDIRLSNNVNPVSFDTHIEAFNSFAKIRINKKRSGMDAPVVVFSFFWQNTGPSIAVINVGTLLRFTGFCEVIADTGIFEGDRNSLGVQAALVLVRANGWGTDPDGNPLDGTVLPVSGNTFQDVASLFAEGGGLFGDVGIAIQSFAAKPVGLGVDFVVIPAGASLLVNVTLLIEYLINLGEEGDDVDRVIVDFATDQFNRRVGCPFLHIQVLT